MFHSAPANQSQFESSIRRQPTNHNLKVQFGASQLPWRHAERMPRNPLWKRSVCLSMISLGKAFSSLGFNHTHAQHTSWSSVWPSSSSWAAFYRVVTLASVELGHILLGHPQPWPLLRHLLKRVWWNPSMGKCVHWLCHLTYTKGLRWSHFRSWVARSPYSMHVSSVHVNISWKMSALNFGRSFLAEDPGTQKSLPKTSRGIPGTTAPQNNICWQSLEQESAIQSQVAWQVMGVVIVMSM